MSLIPCSTIFDTTGCYKSQLLNKKVRNLALEMCFWSVFLSFNSTTRPILLVKIHFKSSKQLLGTKNHPLIPFSTIFDTSGCYKTHLLNKKVSNLALEMWFWSVFLSFNSTTRPILLVKIHFKSFKQFLGMRNYHLNPFSNNFDTPGKSKIPHQEFVYAMIVACTIQQSWYFFHATISFPREFY